MEILPEGKRRFRIKWKGYPSAQNTWEPEEHISQSLINDFIKTQAEKEEKRKLVDKKMSFAKGKAKLLNCDVGQERKILSTEGTG